MSQRLSHAVEAPRGRLGVLVPGMGAVATTFFAGVEAVKRGLGLPIGSLSQLGHIRVGKNPNDERLIREFVPLAKLDELVFGGWDIYPDSAYHTARQAGVLDKGLVEELKPQLDTLRPMSAVFDSAFVQNLSGPNVKRGADKMELAEQLRADIRAFMQKNQLQRCVMIWCGSTESYSEPGPAQESVRALEEAMKRNDPTLPPSMIYAYAALMEGIPFANGAPNLTVDTKALQELSREKRVPICGKDFKTGQTLVKTVLAPMLRARMLGLAGWFSTNLLGNRDGEVLNDPGSFKTKEISKLSVLETILEPQRYPDLYGGFAHKVTINYYAPRGDNKEGWDAIDLTGWLGYPMQMKVNFLCRDSILAAPIVLDLALFMDLAQRAGMSGTQDWLSFYFKSPMAVGTKNPEHDLFAQLAKLKNTLRHMMGVAPMPHEGMEYYA